MTRIFQGLIVMMAMVCFTNRAGADGKTSWVIEPDGTKQCEKKKPIALTKGRSRLKAAKINVIKAVHTHDGMMRIQMCGADTGGINAFEIPEQDVEKAVSQVGLRRPPKSFKPN